ncbi:MAG TPA: glycoside hydrolase domain-containing protein [Longimicrobiales bacterium]|nr:glycoside hydrolase domain-containing protein [Longimicrobiales bacterium]
MTRRTLMRPFRAAALLLMAHGLAACASTGHGPSAPGGVLPGFDTRTYPGDAAMRTWLDASPYRWVGYYLPAPCYTGTSWVGTRERIASIGWGVAPLFVGEQDWSAIQPGDTTVAEQGARCTTQNLTPAQGAADAVAADSVMDAEGFPPGTPVFLDVERMERVSRAMEEYVHAWFTEMLARGRYTPSLYAHERNVTPLFERARAAFAAAGRSDEPFLWVARAGALDVGSRPADSGILSAAIWQGRFDVDETWGDVTLRVDANVASVAVPGIMPYR